MGTELQGIGRYVRLSSGINTNRNINACTSVEKDKQPRLRVLVVDV